MEEKPTFLFGASFKTRLPTGQTTVLVATMKDVGIVLDGAPTKQKNGKKRLALQAKIAGKLYPLHYQSSPFIVSTKQDMSKGRFKYTVVDFEYKSELDAYSASKCRTDLEEMDAKIRTLLWKHRSAIWPLDENITKENVYERYQGFTQERIWIPPPQPIDEEPSNALDEAVIEDADGENPKLVYEPGMKKRSPKESKKRKAPEPEIEEPVEEPVEEKAIHFPPKLRIFPRAAKNGMCKVYSHDNKPLLLSSVSAGLEVVPIFDIGLLITDGKVQPSCTGLQFTLKEDHRAPSNLAASAAFVGETY